MPPIIDWGEIFFSKEFFKGGSCPKNSGGFTGLQNFTVPISDGWGDEGPSIFSIGT